MSFGVVNRMKFAYYPGCTTELTALEYDKSLREAAQCLGVTLKEIPDWNCCGASSSHIINTELALALTSRNLAQAERMSLDMATPCPACFIRHRMTKYKLVGSPHLKTSIEENIGTHLALKRNMRHVLDIFFNDVGIDVIRKKIRKSLLGLRVVCYYGCYLVRPSEITRFDDTENPTTLDKLMTSLGAEAVDWAGKVDCCGGGTSITAPEIHKKLAGKIILYALQAEAEAIVVACPLCQTNLDIYQPKDITHLPVFYFSELTALALGSSNVKEWLSRHMTNTASLLERKNLL